MITRMFRPCALCRTLLRSTVPFPFSDHYLVGVTNAGLTNSKRQLFVVDLESGESRVSEPVSPGSLGEGPTARPLSNLLEGSVVFGHQDTISKNAHK